jgi:heptosyltransferase-2
LSRILVIRGGAIGDFILTLPAIRLLRDNFPACHLEILGYRHITRLAEGRFYAQATHSIEYGPMATFFNPRAQPDSELSEYFASFQQVVSYIYDPDALFGGCLRRAGVKNLISASPKVNDSAHASHQLARPLEQLALWLEDPAARIFPSFEDCAEADKILHKLPAPIFAVHPGSGGEHKNWPIDHWRQLIGRILKASPSAHVLIVGGESDSARVAFLRSAFPTGKIAVLENLPLPTLGAVLARCHAFIGHDSGISHLAAAAGTRCLLLFGPTDPEVWAPANQGVQVLPAPDGQLSALEVSSVFRKVEEILSDAG